MDPTAFPTPDPVSIPLPHGSVLHALIVVIVVGGGALYRAFNQKDR